MGRKATLDKLPEHISQYLDECLKNNTHEKAAELVNVYLKEKGLEPIVTERIVQRYSANTKKLKNERQLTNQIIQILGSTSNIDIGTVVGAMTGNLIVKFISDLDGIASLDDAKKLAQIAKITNETGAINFDNRIRQEEYEQQHKAGVKIINPEELDEVYKEQYRIQAEMQAQIANRQYNEDLEEDFNENLAIEDEETHQNDDVETGDG